MTGGLRPPFTILGGRGRHHVVIHYVITYCCFGVGPAVFFRLLAPVVFSTSCFIGFPVGSLGMLIGHCSAGHSEVDHEPLTTFFAHLYTLLACTSLHVMALNVALWLKPSGLRLVNVPSLRVLEREMRNELARGPALETNQLTAHSDLVTLGF